MSTAASVLADFHGLALAGLLGMLSASLLGGCGHQGSGPEGLSADGGTVGDGGTAGDGGATDSGQPDGGGTGGDGGLLDGGTAGDAGTSGDGGALFETDCGDGLDNDGDGYADCLDADCLDSSDCQAETDCGNKEDDDEDGLVDCDDSDCALAEGCYELDCTDGLDDDGDGLIDCLDGDCYLREGCIEDICDDKIDNDGDGGIDCMDVDCYVSRACMASCTQADPGAMSAGELVSGSTEGADDSFDDVASCGTEGGPDVGFIYEVPASGCFVLSTQGSAFDTVLRLYESCEASDELSCADDVDGTDNTSRLYVDGDPGQLYVVAVDGVDSSASGDFTVSISEYDVPVEEDIGSVTGDAAYSGFIDGLEDLDWLPSCAASSVYDELLLWTTPSDGSWTFDLSESAFDTVLAVVGVGDRCPEELGCNDDISYPKILTSSVTVDLVADQQVVVWVSSYDSGEVGPYQLDINLAR